MRREVGLLGLVGEVSGLLLPLRNALFWAILLSLRLSLWNRCGAALGLLPFLLLLFAVVYCLCSAALLLDTVVTYAAQANFMRSFEERKDAVCCRSVGRVKDDERPAPLVACESQLKDTVVARDVMSGVGIRGQLGRESKEKESGDTSKGDVRGCGQMSASHGR